MGWSTCFYLIGVSMGYGVEYMFLKMFLVCQLCLCMFSYGGGLCSGMPSVGGPCSGVP